MFLMQEPRPVTIDLNRQNNRQRMELRSISSFSRCDSRHNLPRHLRLPISFTRNKTQLYTKNPIRVSMRTKMVPRQTVQLSNNLTVYSQILDCQLIFLLQQKIQQKNNFVFAFGFHQQTLQYNLYFEPRKRNPHIAQPFICLVSDHTHTQIAREIVDSSVTIVSDSLAIQCHTLKQHAIYFRAMSKDTFTILFHS